MPIVKKTFYTLIAIFLVLMLWLTICHPDWIVAGMPKAGAQGISDQKGDLDCPQPFTTVGRCADKCPLQTDTLLGYDPTTGAAICKAAPTGCPYGDSVPLGPECDKLATEQSTPAEPAETFVGK